LGGLHRAHVGTVTGNVAPVLPEVAAALTGLVCHGVYDWQSGLRRAHVGAVTRNVAPILPVVAAALTGAFYHGLGVYDGFNVYDC
jgi:hypothetical protein